MRNGRPPRYPEIDVPMEIHHKGGRKIPNPHCRENLEPLWPWEHAATDKYRFYNGPKPGGN